MLFSLLDVIGIEAYIRTDNIRQEKYPLNYLKSQNNSMGIFYK
ncbi:hypothetical protein RV08_GL002445 [Enterococcus mundtii]|nr:hypothetical protein RV08_GL002445 [Enterococcus mundtii]